ncbi:hypothetical protein D9M68_905710 [compost metagenome]
MLMICLLSPSISATSPVSRSVVLKMLVMLKLFIFFFGRFSGGTITFQVAFICSMPNSGGVGGSCWM